MEQIMKKNTVILRPSEVKTGIIQEANTRIN